MTDAATADPDEPLYEPRLWRDRGWTAQVIKNEDDDGWAVAMYQQGEPEPALVGPWTMGRDKKNPKPLDSAAFNTLVKTASEVLRRHEQHLHATLHQQVVVNGSQGSEGNSGAITVALDIEPDDDNPSATLSATDEAGARLAQVRVRPNFKLNRASAEAWIAAGYARPA